MFFSIIFDDFRPGVRFVTKNAAVTMLDQLSGAGKDVIAIGKIQDIFAGKGITEFHYTKGNEEPYHT